MELKDELDERFQRRQWTFQRAGWLLLLILIVASTFGLFGTSPLAGKVETREQGDARYEVEYPRFTRYQHVDRIHVRVHAPSAQGEELRIAFSNEVVENSDIRGSSPDPDGGGASAEGAVYAYKVEDWSQPIVVAFEYEPRKAFWNPGTLTVTAGDSAPVELPLAYWTYP